MPDAVKNLAIGDVLQLQFAQPSESRDRYAVKLMGYVPGQSLIITTPGKQGKTILVREGQSFTVRLLQGSNIFGFVAKVLAVYSKPYPHLHLAYPEEVESAVVRNAPRVTTHFNAEIVNTSQAEDQQEKRHATVVDLSSTGARLMSNMPLGEVGQRILLMLTLQICSGEDRLKVLGMIRSMRELEASDAEKVSIYGIQFIGLNRFQQLLLCSYVLGQIAKERG